MMDFISIPLVVGIICASLYGLFELILRRKERLAIIDKIDGKIDASAFEGRLGLPSYRGKRLSFSALKGGCLFAGIGLGLLVAFFIHMGFMSTPVYYKDNWMSHEMVSVLYGSLVLLCGGIGLIAAFVIEMKIGKKEKQD